MSNISSPDTTTPSDETKLLLKDKADKSRSTDTQALINIIKANIGSGILGMPYAFKNGGIYLGTITLLIVAVITCHTTLILTECKSVLVKRKKRQGEPIDIHTYGDVGRVSMGIIGAAIIDILLVFTQTGFSCAYLIYIGTNMHAMVPQVEEWHAILIALALLVPLCLLRNIKYLTPTSIISEICIIGGMLIVIYYDIENLTTQPFPGNRNIEFFNWKDFPVFFGICIYGYEGIGLALPIEENMQKKSHYPRVFYLASIIISIMMGGFGLIGYIAYGHSVKAVITLNMPPGTVLGIVIKIGLMIALLFSFPIQLFPVSELFDSYVQYILKRFKPEYVTLNGDSEAPSPDAEHGHALTPQAAWSTHYVVGNIHRIIVMLLTAALAISVPDFGDFLSLIGGLGGTMLAFVLPLIIHLITFNKKLSWSVVVKDVSIILFGLIAVVVTTIQSVQNIVEGFNKK